MGIRNAHSSPSLGASFVARRAALPLSPSSPFPHSQLFSVPVLRLFFSIFLFVSVRGLHDTEKGSELAPITPSSAHSGRTLVIGAIIFHFFIFSNRFLLRKRNLFASNLIRFIEERQMEPFYSPIENVQTL